jgi:hypothetical protein
LVGGPLPWLLLTFVGRFEVVSRLGSTPASSCGGAQGAAPAGARRADTPALDAKHGRRGKLQAGLRRVTGGPAGGDWAREARFRGGCDYGGRRTEKDQNEVGLAALTRARRRRRGGGVPYGAARPAGLPCMSGARAACRGARRVAPWPARPSVWARRTGDKWVEGPRQVRGLPRSRRGRPYAGASRKSHVADGVQTRARRAGHVDDVARLKSYSV